MRKYDVECCCVVRNTKILYRSRWGELCTYVCILNIRTTGKKISTSQLKHTPRNRRVIVTLVIWLVSAESEKVRCCHSILCLWLTVLPFTCITWTFLYRRGYICTLRVSCVFVVVLFASTLPPSQLSQTIQYVHLPYLSSNLSSLPVWQIEPTNALKDTIPKIPSKYSQKRNCAASVPISAFMCAVSDLLYIFPRSICLFCCRKICGPILETYKSLTDKWMWKLGLRPRNSFSGNA
jgi:hypothetical protein